MDKEREAFEVWFIECSNAECRITTQLRFEAGDDPSISLSEIWNKRNGDEAEITGSAL